MGAAWVGVARRMTNRAGRMAVRIVDSGVGTNASYQHFRAKARTQIGWELRAVAAERWVSPERQGASVG
ncbi:MAG: hypothetical protein AMXMBFR64_59840 [Myxococcales bacterium]